MRFGDRSSLRVSSNPSVTIQRVRLRLGRKIEASAITHLQQIELFKKMMLNSGWPLAMSGSRRGRPRISFGPAISVGYLSSAEYFDVELSSRLDLMAGERMLVDHVPAGFELRQVKSIPRFFPSLDESLNLAHYKVQSDRLDGSRFKWEEFWKQTNFFVIKKKQDRDVVIDARPCVKSWDLSRGELNLFVRFGPGRTLKPERIIQAVCGFSDEQMKLGHAPSDFSVTRVQLFFEKDDGVLVEP